MKQALAANWRRFLVAAIILDIGLAFLPLLLGDARIYVLLVPLRWLVMMGGAFAVHWAQQSGTVSRPVQGWTTIYLIGAFTAAAMLGGKLLS